MASTPRLLGRASDGLTKEPDTIAWIDQFKPDQVFWDIGANVGIFSLYAAKERGVRVLAFEPAADNYMVIARNIQLNGLEGKVAAYCLAFAGKTDLGTMNLSAQQLGAAVHQFGSPGEASPYLPEGTPTYAQGTIGYRIDDFIRQFDAPFPDHIKLDVDGLETQILAGARETLSDRRLKSIMLELNVTDPDEIARATGLLSDAGLMLASRGREQGFGGQLGANHFFVRG